MLRGTVEVLLKSKSEPRIEWRSSPSSTTVTESPSIDTERIFDPSYRKQGEESVPDSVGRGLAVARQLAHLMGGDLKYRRARGWTLPHR